MIIPCIDLMEGKVVQLVQGREKVLEGGEPLEMIERFRAFREIQVIDLDAAIGTGSNAEIIELLASRAVIRAGGGVRTVEHAASLLSKGVSKVIVGTAAFVGNGINQPFLERLDAARTLIALDSKGGRIVVKGWRESTSLTAEEVVVLLEPYCAGFLCTYVDKEGMLQGTDLAWFRRLRAATSHELTAAGGITTLEEIRELTAMDIHCALGMAIYTGRLDLQQVQEASKTDSIETGEHGPDERKYS